jgi:hypothetical protein
MRCRLVIAIGLLLLISGNLFCQNSQAANSHQEDNKPYFSLEKKTVNFGEIEMGTTKTLLLSFTNTGKKTLVLSDVYTTCGCTTVDWPKDPFLPGKSGTIKISYNPTETGPFNKTISIYTNAQNSSEIVQIEGIVIDK